MLLIDAFLYAPKAFAEDGYSIFHPGTTIEYTSLSKPKDVYIDDNTIAVLDNDNILLSYNGELKTVDYFDTLKQIKQYNADYLLTSANGGKLFLVKRDGTEFRELKFDRAGVEETIAGEYFDINNNYLVTSHSTSLMVYNLSSNITYAFKHDGIDGDTPICINDTHVFFVQNNEIMSMDLSSEEHSSETVASIKPSRMIANNENLYFISEDKIYCQPLNGSNPIELTVDENENYDLGSVVKPTSLQFKGENLVITDDELKAVSEFYIESNKLVFTGYAIAKDKTAFNRIKNDKTKIERFNDELYVLDSHKLTIMKDITEFDSYNVNSYENLLLSEIGNVTSFAVGEDLILFRYSDKTAKLFSKTKKAGQTVLDRFTSDSISITNITDIAYKNGKFYILSENEGVSSVYCTSENLIDFKEILTDFPIAQSFAIDESQNVYIVASDGVYKNNEKIAENDGLTFIKTDLFDNVYSAKDNTIRYLKIDTTNSWETLLTTDSNVTHFTMGADKLEVYYITTDKEFIYKTTALKNANIASLELGGEYIQSSLNAKEDITCYTVNEDKNAYSVKFDSDNNCFNYISKFSSEKEYVYLSSLSLEGVNGTKEFFVLSGANQVIIVSTSNVSQKDIDNLENFDTPKNAFVATSVNGYYIPIISRHCEYALTNEGNTIRLQKGALITIHSAFKFLDVDFYLASFKVGENTVKGYVPQSFTTIILSEHKVYSSYSLEKVHATSLYKNADLTEELLVLEENSNVRVIGSDNNVIKICVAIENGFIEGYISKTAIVNEPNTAIRNILLVLAITACLCGTASFFLLRKKQD